MINDSNPLYVCILLNYSQLTTILSYNTNVLIIFKIESFQEENQ
jgi:hypothetical protein